MHAESWGLNDLVEVDRGGGGVAIIFTQSPQGIIVRQDYPFLNSWFDGHLRNTCAHAVRFTTPSNMCTTYTCRPEGYKIPVGGMFDYVSGANFFGEIIEWCGFAIACWSLPAACFAFCTAMNIGPRALQHHAWYLQKFGATYPKTRCALIPFIL